MTLAHAGTAAGAGPGVPALSRHWLGSLLVATVWPQHLAVPVRLSRLCCSVLVLQSSFVGRALATTCLGDFRAVRRAWTYA